MIEVWNFIVFIIFGVIAVTIIDIVGSIASRKLNFNYTRIFLLSRIIYFIVAYGIALESNAVYTIIGTLLVGVYDATVGFYLAKRLNANWGEHKWRIESMGEKGRLISMVITCLIIGGFGFLLAVYR